jgi:WhiB family transcriptional regulator, redox-sensing transcriptional regulator
VTDRKRQVNWKKDGACFGMDPDLFFPVDGLMTPQAAAACDRCPVREPCLEFGLHEEFGIWGGKTVRDRQRLRKARRQGRAA